MSADKPASSSELSLLARLDHVVYRVERALAGVLFLTMSLVMFLYVIERVTTH